MEFLGGERKVVVKEVGASVGTALLVVSILIIAPQLQIAIPVGIEMAIITVIPVMIWQFVYCGGVYPYRAFVIQLFIGIVVAFAATTLNKKSES